MARALMPVEPWCRVDVLACWWIAIKFDSADAPYASDLLHTFPGVCRTAGELRSAEAAVLARHGFVLPRHTAVHEVRAHLGASTDAWLHALLHVDALALHSGAGWLEMLGSAVQGLEAAVLQVARCALPLEVRTIVFGPRAFGWSTPRRAKKRRVATPESAAPTRRLAGPSPL